jgi:hypothetical protein
MKRSGLLALMFAAAIAGCGGGGSGDGSQSSNSPVEPANVLAIAVNSGLQNNYANGLFASVTLCAPGSSSNCQTIDNVLVDTGSYGLRILGSALTLSLPSQANGAGTTAECTVFADGYTWGPVVTADVMLSGETASNLPVQVIGAANFTAAPEGCSSGSGQQEDTLAQLGSNGVLGIGLFRYDCGSDCAGFAGNQIYWSCTSSGCNSALEPLEGQVQNPVALFAKDNNGIVVELPDIASGGQPTAAGTLIFGIGTETNNALDSANVIAAGANGDFTTLYGGTSFPNSFIDSGSNAYVFTDPGIAACTSDTGFFCPAETLDKSATIDSSLGASVSVSFSVANAQALFSANDGGDAAFDDLAGPAGSTLSGAFDWGMPFFYGRNVYYAIEGASAGGVTGPYYAF